MLNVQYTLEQRSQLTRSVTLWGVAVNLVLAIVKSIGGVVGNSAALLADGIHSLSDLISDGMVLFAAHHANARPDEQHPYGHARFETLTTVALGTLLTLVGLAIAYDAINRLIVNNPTEIPHLFTLFIAAAAIISKEILYQRTMQISTRIHSKMLAANAWHHRTDAISSIIVFIGIGGAMLGMPMLDAITAIIVAVMVIKMGVVLGYQSMVELVDTALEPRIVEKIKQKILSIDDVQALHMLRSRRMGHTALIDVHIQVAPRLSVSEGHRIAESVERVLTDSFDEITDVTVHIDPENDEQQTSYQHLPARNALISQLQSTWSTEPALSNISDITLHYLNGEISVEATLPLAQLPTLEQGQHLQQLFKKLSVTVNGVSDAELKFL